MIELHVHQAGQIDHVAAGRAVDHAAQGARGAVIGQLVTGRVAAGRFGGETRASTCAWCLMRPASALVRFCASFSRRDRVGAQPLLERGDAGQRVVLVVDQVSRRHAGGAARPGPGWPTGPESQTDGQRSQARAQCVRPNRGASSMVLRC